MQETRPSDNWVTNATGDIYCLLGVPEEVAAVLFAYYSRSTGSLRDALDQMIADGSVQDKTTEQLPEQWLRANKKAQEFHEKWVVGYGHSSVAEHAVAHIAIENVSIIVAKIIEDCRLASYTEKSTRYVPYSQGMYYRPTVEEVPEAIDNHQLYHQTMDSLWKTYEEIRLGIAERLENELDRSAYKTERGFKNACLAQACDTARYLLPAGTLTNLGVTANARTLAHMIRKLLSHPLAEARMVGERIREEATKVLPTLVRHVERGSPHLAAQHDPETVSKLIDLLDGRLPPKDSLVSVNIPFEEGRAIDLIADAMVYEHSGCTRDQLLYGLHSEWDPKRKVQLYNEKMQLLRAHNDRRSKYENLGRAFEALNLGIEVVCDYGAYRDTQRHRMNVQYAQPLGVDLGFEIPTLIKKYGYEEAYERAMAEAAAAYKNLRKTGWRGANYVVPLAHRVRCYTYWNFRALAHFVELRSAQQGHPSYRRIAQAIYRELVKYWPFLASLLRVDMNEYELSRPEK